MPAEEVKANLESVEQFKQRFGRRLAALRREKGWTQEQLARRMKVDPVSVAFLEGAKRSPSFAMLYKLSRALGVNPIELFRA